MEKRQQDHITKNFSNLVDNTTWNTTCCMKPMERGIFGKEDIAILKAIANERDRIMKFYELFMTKKGSYLHLMDTLDAGNQSGALDILRRLSPSQIDQQPINSNLSSGIDARPSPLTTLVTKESNTKFTEHGPMKYDKSAHKQIGSGASTKVYSGFYKGVPAAIKKIYCATKKDTEDKEEEIHICMKLNGHKNIVKILGTHQEKENIFIAMELCNGTLKQWVENKIPKINKSTNKPIDVLKQITEGIAYLHKQRIVHRDLKPDNVLLLQTSDGVIVKIADFGISRELPEDVTSMAQTRQMGSKGWKAPEVLNPELGDKMSPETDIFSLGCIYYYVMTDGLHPFRVEGVDIDQNIINSRYSLKSELLPTDFREMIESMIQNDRKKRPRINDILVNLFMFRQ